MAVRDVHAPRTADSGRMNANTFIVIALEAVALLSMVALAWTLHRFAAPGPKLDRG